MPKSSQPSPIAYCVPGDLQARRPCGLLQCSRSRGRNPKATQPGRWERIFSHANGAGSFWEGSPAAAGAERGHGLGRGGHRGQAGGVRWDWGALAGRKCRPGAPDPRVSTPLPRSASPPRSRPPPTAVANPPPQPRSGTRRARPLGEAERTSEGSSFPGGCVGKRRVETLAILCNLRGDKLPLRTHSREVTAPGITLLRP